VKKRDHAPRSPRVRAARDADCTCSYARGQKYKSGHGHSTECARFAYEDWRYWKRRDRRDPATGLREQRTPATGAQGRKRVEDAAIKFLGNGKVIVSAPGRQPIASKRGDPIGSTMWFVLHILGLTAYDGDEFFLSVKRMKP